VEGRELVAKGVPLGARSQVSGSWSLVRGFSEEVFLDFREEVVETGREEGAKGVPIGETAQDLSSIAA